MKKQPSKPPKPPKPGKPRGLALLISDLHISQGAFARLINVDPSYISHVLAGRKVPSLRRANMMATVLRVDLDTVSAALPKR